MTTNAKKTEKTAREKAGELLTVENVQAAVQWGSFGVRLLKAAAPLAAAAVPVVGAAAAAMAASAPGSVQAVGAVTAAAAKALLKL